MVNNPNPKIEIEIINGPSFASIETTDGVSYLVLKPQDEDGDKVFNFNYWVKDTESGLQTKYKVEVTVNHEVAISFSFFLILDYETEAYESVIKGAELGCKQS